MTSSCLKFRNLVVFACAALFLAILFTAPTVGHQQAPLPNSKDYLYPDRLLQAERQAFLAKAAVKRRFDRVEAADVIAFLAARLRNDEALAVAREAARQQPAKIGAIANALAPLGNTFSLHKEITAASLEMRSHLGALSREEAARAAYGLLNLEWALNETARYAARPSPAPVDKRPLLRAFAQEYAGTPEAGLADLDLLIEDFWRTPGPIRIDNQRTVYAQFARDHPGTVDGAKALYRSGQTYGANDATRFMETLKIVAELESGKFPPCEWVDRAAELVLEFSIGDAAVFSARMRDDVALKEDLARIGAARHEFNLARIDAPSSAVFLNLEEGLARGSFSYFDDKLIEESKNSDALRYLRAKSDSVPVRWSDKTFDHAASIAQSNRTLEELSLRATAPWRQWSLASLASQHFAQRDYKAAIGAYRRYLSEYPQSGWAWVAAIRIGQAQAESRDFEAARQSFRAVAAAHADQQVARIVALAFASQTSAALGDFGAELADIKLAIEAWDPAMGPSLEIGKPHSAFASRSGVASGDWTAQPGIMNFESLDPGPGAAGSPKGTGNILTLELRRAALSARAAALPATLAQPLGNDFETARWRLDHADWGGALPILERVSEKGRRPLRDDAAKLARRARLERALAWCDVSAPRTDELAAAREFEALASGPKDFTAAAARIARAALASKQGKPDDARRWMAQGLEVWRWIQQNPRAPAKGSLEDDVRKIRNAVLDPYKQYRALGGISEWTRSPDEFPYTPGPHIYRSVPSVTTVTLAGGRTEDVALPNQEPDAFIVTLLSRFGVRPDQFADGSHAPENIADLVLELHPNLPESKFAWLFFPPVISSIQYTDELRARAEVSVRFGSAGMNLVLLKTGAAWEITRTTKWWIE